MSDFPSPVPQSSLARFGTSVVGKPFEWEASTEDGSSTVLITARARASLSFEDVMRYTTGRHAQLVQTAKSATAMRDALKEIDAGADDYMAQFNRLVADRLQFENNVWLAAIDILLILVNPPDRERLRDPLIKGDPKKVNELRTWLEHEVLAVAQEDAATVANVDPTLRQSPPPSASSPDSGDDSDSAESTTTS